MVRVRVPATSANMGPGFDCFGIAFNLYNEMAACEIEKGIEISSPGSDTCYNEARNKHNLVYQAMNLVFKKSGYKCKGIRIIHEKSDIPRTRGLGSSAACVVGGVLLANEIAGQPFSKRELLNLAVSLEGHSDNATAAMYGGFAASFIQKDVTYFQTVNVSDMLRFVLMVPHFTVSTQKSRKTLPKMVKLGDAVHNISHASMLAMAFSTGNFKGLPLLFHDTIHEKYRKNAIPHADVIMKASHKFGAYGTYVSGSGPTIAAVVSQKNTDKYMEFMQNFIKENEYEYDIISASVDNRGALIDKKQK